MDISFFTSAGGDAWSLDECARWAKENGFDAVRLSAGGAVDPDRVLAEGPDAVSATLKKYGIYLAALSAHNNLLDDDPELADAGEDRLRKSIMAASVLGAPVVVTHAGSPVGWHFYGQYSSPPGNPGDRSLELVDRFRERFEPIVRLAEDRGVTIALDGAVRMGNIACNPEMWEAGIGRRPIRSSRSLLRSVPLALDDDPARRGRHPHVRGQVGVRGREGCRGKQAHAVPPGDHWKLVVAVPGPGTRTT